MNATPTAIIAPQKICVATTSTSTVTTASTTVLRGCTFEESTKVKLTERQLPQNLPSPKSVLLENIQQKDTDDTTTSTESAESSQITSVTDSILTPTVIETDFSSSDPLPESSKSPILSQPKTIRFPANNSRNGSRRSGNQVVGHCYWDGCNAKCETSSNLLDHLQSQHVNSQTGPFSCRWANCKVHGRESCSRKWLERHVLSHGGSKFFKCIFDKCRMRFGSQVNFDDNVIKAIGLQCFVI